MNKRKTEISLLRVIAMIMIILCHICNYLHQPWLSQFLNVGVYIFLLISGYLYSNKKIEKAKQWFIGRWEKLCIPIIIWTAIVLVYAIIIRRDFPEIKDVILLATNLQGISWVILRFPSISATGPLSGLGNLWFVSIIMLCYLLTIIVKKNRKIDNNIGKITIALFLASIMLVPLNINLFYITCYFIGYSIGKKQTKYLNCNYIIITLAFILSIIVRLSLKRLIDGTEMYDIATVGVTHTIIALWISYSVIKITNKNRIIKTISEAKTILFLDLFSYYIYITHYYFLVKYFNLNSIQQGIIIQLLLLAALTCISTYAVYKAHKLTRIFYDKK